MPEPRIEFKYVSRLNAEALGKPGQRTFRILAESGPRSAVMWLEKQHLFQLAVAIRQLMLASEREEAPEDVQVGDDHLSTPSGPLEFQVGKISLGEDIVTGKVIMEAHDLEDGDQGADEQATLRVWITRTQAQALAEEALEVCAAGRPLCPLCGSPMDDQGHTCPRTNGHHRDAVDF